MQVLVKNKKLSKIRIQKSTRPDNVKGGKTVGMKTLVSMTVQQFKALVGAKSLVVAAASKSPPAPPKERAGEKGDIVQKALEVSGVGEVIRQTKKRDNNDDGWASLVKGEAPKGCAVSSWMEELWAGDKKKKKKKKPIDREQLPTPPIAKRRKRKEHADKMSYYTAPSSSSHPRPVKKAARTMSVSPDGENPQEEEDPQENPQEEEAEAENIGGGEHQEEERCLCFQCVLAPPQ